MASPALQAFRQSMNVAVTDLQSPEAKRDFTNFVENDVARIVAEQTGRAGVKPDVTWAVNGRPRAALSTVKLPGPIVYAFDYRREIALITREALRQASPKSSGEYANSHVILVDGREVEEVPADLPDSAEIAITNTVPYSRRLEIGRKVDGTPFVVKVPPRIYETVSKRIVARNYRDVARITFGYVDLVGAYVPRGGRRRGRGDAVRYPAIFIKAL